MSILTLLEKKIEENQFQIYCDMDGVLTDWDRSFAELGDDLTHGLDARKFEEKYGPEKMWQMISEFGGKEFWTDMKWMSDGKKLWNYIKKYNPIILTAPSRQKECKDGKEIWIKRELGEDIQFIFEKNKYKYAGTYNILIDDLVNKINDWVNNDGIGILHYSADDTIKNLKEMML